MSVQTKFCGMMRSADVDAALAAGASYVGAILAGGPRNLSHARALETLRSAEGRVKRVAVVKAGSADAIAESAAGFDVVQVHGDAEPQLIRELRAHFRGEIWAVVRCDSAEVPANLSALYADADAVVFDKKSASGLGGTGQCLDWNELAKSLDGVRSGKTILAGGLTAESVGDAIRSISPDVVDVSSGVESSVGVKDHNLMRKFAAAVVRVETGR